MLSRDNNLWKATLRKEKPPVEWPMETHIDTAQVSTIKDTSILDTVYYNILDIGPIDEIYKRRIILKRLNRSRQLNTNRKWWWIRYLVK